MVHDPYVIFDIAILLPILPWYHTIYGLKFMSLGSSKLVALVARYCQHSRQSWKEPRTDQEKFQS